MYDTKLLNISSVLWPNCRCRPIYYYYYYHYYTIWMPLVTGLSFMVLLLNQRWSSPLRLQASHCSTFRIMCDVPIIITIIIIIVYCHRPFLPGTSLEPSVIPTAQASSFTLQYFPYYVWCSNYYYYYYYYSLLSQAFPSCYFSWTSGDPHSSRFKLHIAVLSVLCVMFQLLLLLLLTYLLELSCHSMAVVLTLEQTKQKKNKHT